LRPETSDPALRVEYEAIVRNGFLLQLDCPDLALERHTSYRDRPLADFVDFVEMVIAAINKAVRNISREKIRLHACWGNYEGPHDRDVALRDIWRCYLLFAYYLDSQNRGVEKILNVESSRRGRGAQGRGNRTCQRSGFLLTDR
jgi:hypothetical protein